MKNTILFILFFSFNVGLIAQESTLDYKLISLKEVTFHSPDEGDFYWIILFDDPTPTGDPDGLINSPDLISGVSSTTAFKDDGTKLPVAYVGGGTAKVSAKFFIDCANSFYIKGIGADGHELPWKLMEPSPSGEVIYPATNFSKNFPPKKVGFYEEFEIKWYISQTGVGDGELLKESMNPLYITYGVPFIGEINHSLIYIGCKNAVGKTNELAIVNAIYSDFADQCVSKYNSTDCMKYWGGGVPRQDGSDLSTCFTAQALLAYGDATCGAWADFFDVLIKVQGISGSKVSLVQWKGDYILPSKYVKKLKTLVRQNFGEFSSEVRYHFGRIPNAMFFVKHWGIPDLEEFYLEYYLPGSNITLPNGYVLLGGDITGTASQGNANPRFEFENHVIVKYGR